MSPAAACCVRTCCWPAESRAQFVNGYQYRGFYHYADVAYNERFAKHSPGTVLLYLLIQDLFAHHPPSA